MLRTLTYSEISSLSQDGSWSYDPTPRHDVPVAAIALGAQSATLSALFSPLRLQRIDDLSNKYGSGQTIDMTQLFDWSRASIFGSIADGSVAKEGLVRRNLQTMFARYLANMVVMPLPGTPGDAQALARVALEGLRHDAATALNRGNLDDLTRGHLLSLEAIATQALTATRVSP